MPLSEVVGFGQERSKKGRQKGVWNFQEGVLFPSECMNNLGAIQMLRTEVVCRALNATVIALSRFKTDADSPHLVGPDFALTLLNIHLHRQPSFLRHNGGGT